MADLGLIRHFFQQPSPLQGEWYSKKFRKCPKTSIYRDTSIA